MKVLHIVKAKDHGLALSTAIGQAEEPSNEVTLLLVHDAVLWNPPHPPQTDWTGWKNLRVCALKSDVEARGIQSSYPLIDYQEMLRLIFDSEKVICW